jgi:hypothetical protein
MTANDVQVLIAPVIGVVTAIAIAMISLVFTLRQERRYRIARTAKTDIEQAPDTTIATRNKQRREPIAHY